MPIAVIIGAGPGLGLSMARRFGREGHRIALLSRRPERHAAYVAELASAGIDAASFQVDVLDQEALARALDRVVAELGDIDVVYYGPSPHDTADVQRPIDEASGADAVQAMSRFYPAMDVVARVLPRMLERGVGTLLFTSAISAVLPVPALGAMTLPAAAARNYALALHAALAPHNVYVGVLVIGGLIEGSDLHTAAAGVDAGLVLDPAQIADAAWQLAAERTSAEVVIAPRGRSLGLTLLLLARALRVRIRGAGPRGARAGRSLSFPRPSSPPRGRPAVAARRSRRESRPS